MASLAVNQRVELSRRAGCWPARLREGLGGRKIRLRPRDDRRWEGSSQKQEAPTEYGESRLIGAVLPRLADSAARMLEAILDDGATFAAGRLADDDITVLVAKVRSADVDHAMIS
jgi:hypothetical protein